MSRRPEYGWPTVYASRCRPGSGDWCWPACGHWASSRTWCTGGWTRHSAVEGPLPRRRLDWLARGRSRNCPDCSQVSSTLYTHVQSHDQRSHCNKSSKDFDKKALRRGADFWGEQCSVTPISRQHCSLLQQWSCDAVIIFCRARSIDWQYFQWAGSDDPKNCPPFLGGSGHSALEILDNNRAYEFTYLLTYPHRLRIQYLDVYNSVKFMNFKIFFKFSKI